MGMAHQALTVIDLCACFQQHPNHIRVTSFGSKYQSSASNLMNQLASVCNGSGGLTLSTRFTLAPSCSSKRTMETLPCSAATINEFR